MEESPCDGKENGRRACSLLWLLHLFDAGGVGVDFHFICSLQLVFRGCAFTKSLLTSGRQFVLTS